MSEAQAFFLLSTLCDRLLPGYYSQTMYGTLLDQRVFESLVEKTMPILWDHLIKSDIQLSVVSLPWFLSLYINSMPLVFAFRVLDVFFLEGPKVLFQVGLAILRINGEELLDAQDDGAFISVLKHYFSTLDESAHPNSDNEKFRAVTRFQELIVVAFKEFSGITQNTIAEERTKHKDAVLASIESFAKRTQLRNLGPESKRLNVNDLSSTYDRFYKVLYERAERLEAIRVEEVRIAAMEKTTRNQRKASGAGTSAEVIAPSMLEQNRMGYGPSPTLMDFDGFREFLAGICPWAVADSVYLNPHQSQTPRAEGYLSSQIAGAASYYLGGGALVGGLSPLASPVSKSRLSPWGNGPEPADHHFMQRLFRRWDADIKNGLSLQNFVAGLAGVKGTRDIMSSISYFFELYDDDGDGKVDREGILRISEALLFITRKPSLFLPEEEGSGAKDPMKGWGDERILNSVSEFIRRCFEYADPDHPENRDRRKQGEANQETGQEVDDGEKGMDKGNDLLDLSDSESEKTPGTADDEEEDLIVTSRPPSPDPLGVIPQPPSITSEKFAAHSQPKGHSRSESNYPPRISSYHAPSLSANLALDPANPLHITLPTFRMVILADELLERFFEMGFAESFVLSDIAQISSSSPIYGHPNQPGHFQSNQQMQGPQQRQNSGLTTFATASVTSSSSGAAAGSIGSMGMASVLSGPVAVAGAADRKSVV